jgi:anti-sigma factor RsiW
VTSCEHPELKQLLYRLVRGEIENADERREVVQHIQECAECRGIFQELQWVLGSLRPTTPAEHQQLMAGLRGEDGPNRDGETRGSSGRATRSGGWLQRVKRWLESGGGRS